MSATVSNQRPQRIESFDRRTGRKLGEVPRATANDVALWMPYAETAETAILGLAKMFNGRTVGERLSGAFTYLRNRPR